MSIPPHRSDAIIEQPDPAFVEAVDRLLREHGEVSPVSHAPDVLRVETPAGPMRVKRWPAGTTADAIAAERQLLRHLRASGLSFIPEPVAGPGEAESIAIEGGARVDVQTWLPGSPALRTSRPSAVSIPGTASLEQLAVATTALAQVHVAGAPVIAERALPAFALTTFHQTVAREARNTREQLQPYIRQSPHLRSWLRAADHIVPTSADAIGALVAGDANRMVASHLRVWPEHLLYLRQEGAPVVGGLVGWSGAGAASPLIDLAQSIVRLRGWSKEAGETAVGAYTEGGGTLLPEERRALPVIIALDIVLVMARLLVARLEPPRGGEWIDGLGVRTSMEKLVIASDAIGRMLEGYDQPAPVYRRVWEHRPPPGKPWPHPPGSGGRPGSGRPGGGKPYGPSSGGAPRGGKPGGPKPGGGKPGGTKPGGGRGA
jgi:hypothetical protein